MLYASGTNLLSGHTRLPEQHAAYTFKLPSKSLQVVDNLAGTRLFVVLERSDAVSIIDTEQYVETDSVPLHGIAPTDARIAPSPDGSTLYGNRVTSARPRCPAHRGCRIIRH